MKLALMMISLFSPKFAFIAAAANQHSMTIRKLTIQSSCLSVLLRWQAPGEAQPTRTSVPRKSSGILPNTRSS